jgi:uncharacterized DUF497 family protein
MSLVFAWDPHKARTNQRIHNVTFAEAASVFADPLARIFVDEDHSVNESREIIVGHTLDRRLLLVCFTEQKIGTIRIISARRATTSERYDYEEHITS